MEDYAVILSVLGLPEEGRVRTVRCIVLARAYSVSSDLRHLLLWMLTLILRVE